MLPSAGGDAGKGRCPTQGKGKEHSKTSDYLLQTNPGEIIGSGVFYLDAMARLPEVGEDSSAVQFNTVWIDADPVSCPEEYKAEAEAEFDSAQSPT